ncbi:MAG: hypothetical protein ABSD38_24740 [Syntrophorhabdales bacterium]|jgi:hypothetical protein
MTELTSTRYHVWESVKGVLLYAGALLLMTTGRLVRRLSGR